MNEILFLILCLVAGLLLDLVTGGRLRRASMGWYRRLNEKYGMGSIKSEDDDGDG